MSKKVFSRKVQLASAKYIIGLLIAGFICWGFVSFVRDDNWLAVSALASLVLAIAAFTSIIQVRINQRREKRERLLNEIIEWAVDVAKVGTGTHIAIGATASTEEMVRVTVTNILFEYQSIRARSKYIRNIAFFFGDVLNNAVKNVIENIDKHMEYLEKTSDDKYSNNMAGESGKLLQESINTLIEKAVKIKIRAIS